MITSRIPRNPIGWIFCLMAILMGLGNFAYQFADYTLYVSPAELPGGDVAAVMQNATLPPCFGLLALCALIFPDGTLPTPRWRFVAWTALVGSVVIAIAYTFRRGPLDPPFTTVVNQLALGPRVLMESAANFGWAAMAAAIGLSGVAMAARFRRSRGVERKQLKWMAFAGAMASVLFVGNLLTFIVGIKGLGPTRLAVLGLAFSTLPIAAALAILRYRLYDIDRIISRAVAYILSIALLTAAYFGLVILGTILTPWTGSSPAVVALATLILAGVFRPFLVRMKSFVDRRFNRVAYNASVALDEFSRKVRDEVDIARLTQELLATVNTALEPQLVSLWLDRDRDDVHSSQSRGVGNAG